MKAVPPIRIGFFGAGNWARRNHLPAIRYICRHYGDRFDVRLVALCERDAGIAEEAKAEFEIERTYSRAVEFAEDQDINCFVVVVRPASLREVMDTLLPRGLPVMSEKPPGATLSDARYFSDAVKVPNLAGFNRRYFPLNRKFAQLLEKVEEPYYVRACMARHERYDGMPGNDLDPFVVGTGIHLIDLLRDLFGDVGSCTTSVMTVPSNRTRAWHCDVTFASGTTGHLSLLPCSGTESETVEVHSRRTSLFLHGCQYGKIEPPGSIVVHRDGTEVETIVGDRSLPEVVAAGFVDEYLDFFRAVAYRSIARSTFQGALQSMALAETIEHGMPYASGGAE